MVLGYVDVVGFVGDAGKGEAVLVVKVGEQIVCENGEWLWGSPEFFEGDGDFDAIGGLGRVKVDIGGFRGERHGAGELFGQLGDTR